MKTTILKNLLLILGISLIFCQRANTQVKKLKSSYELSNSPQWLKIFGGYATFIQIDYNNDGLDDVVDFEGYDLSVPYTWPGPNFYKNTGNGLVIDTIAVSNKKVFARKMISGDYNNDGYLDIFLITGMDGAGGMDAPTPPTYLMTNINSKSFKVDSLGGNGSWSTATSADVDLDGDLDIISFSTGHGGNTNFLNEFLKNDGKGVFKKQPSNIDSIGWVDRAELIDMNNDSYPDLVMNDVFSLTGEYANRFRILWNDKKGNFHQNNSTTISIPNDLFVLDIDAYDVDNDGYKEIMFPMNDPQGKWRLFIFKTTDNKTFIDSSQFLIQDNPMAQEYIIWNEPLSVYDLDGNGRVDIMLNNRNTNMRWEWNGKAFVRNKCNSNVKPIFNTSKYEFCSGDSLKLSISNVNAGDTLKWYFGLQSDLTNTSTKIFKDSTKVFVTRTDLLGCMISSDTIKITKLSTPNKPEAIVTNSYCLNATVTSLSATASNGNKLLWYGLGETGGAPTNTAPIPLSSKAGTFDYYVSQISLSNGCESPRTKITVKINPLPSRPTFSTLKFGFCNGDSLKLSITNFSKGDTLKWYFGAKSDLTNVSNKTFTDSTKLFVTRTDSLGCMISSDTIQITKYGIPSPPTIFRDTANNLVASSNGITWYKDGTKIADTTQKFKPTTNGLYTATTTQNGCTSSMSQSYYYLTSSLTNLANGEYIRISPNPTSGDIRVDYRLNTTTDLFISINDLNGRAIISNQRIKPGSKINLRGAASSSYIVVVKDKKGRLITTQKILKE